MSNSSPQIEPDGPTCASRHRPAVSLAVLAVMSVTFAVLSFQVVRPFALPLFLAAVFAVIAMPLHERLTALCGGRGWLSALLITVSLLFLLLGPMTAGFLTAYRRALDIVALFERSTREPVIQQGLFDRLARLTQSDPRELRDRAVEVLHGGEQMLFSRAAQAVGNIVSFGVGAVLFLFAGFFFLKDGRSIVQAWEGLTPLDLDQDRQIRREFAIVCRAVVSSTFLAALAQALAFGVGVGILDFAFGLGLGRWLVLLMLLVFVCAMIPVVGTPVVWLPLTVWLIHQQHYLAGVALALFGSVIVANVDNLVRILVLRGSAGLHPLLALVSVLGGIERMGVIGAFVGPVVAGVFVTLLRILKFQLDRFEASFNEPHLTADADSAARDNRPQ